MALKSLMFWLVRIAFALVLTASAFGGSAAFAQSAGEPAAVDRSATGGAQNLADILARQRGEAVALDAGTGAGSPLPIGSPLAVQGVSSDSEFWRAIRQGSGDITVSIPDKNAAVLVQDDGGAWLKTRNETLTWWAKKVLLGTLILLTIFFLLRGRIRIGSGPSGVKIDRFTTLERFGHWLLATTFIILGVTGLALLFGRNAVIPALDTYHAWSNDGQVLNAAYGKEQFAAFAGVGKWLHNNLSWAFMLALVLIFFMWVLRNIPTWTDVKWLAKGGGIIGKGHPSARKFNAGQKIIFWMTILMGASISASGLAMLFPYELPMFAATFAKINDLSAMAGYPMALATEMSPIQEMQYSQMWHTIMSIAMIAMIFAHIYIGSIGMQGAFSAMGSGKVDANWAREHHDLWVEEMARKGKLPSGTNPAE